MLWYDNDMETIQSAKQLIITCRYGLPIIFVGKSISRTSGFKNSCAAQGWKPYWAIQTRRQQGKQHFLISRLQIPSCHSPKFQFACVCARNGNSCIVWNQVAGELLLNRVCPSIDDIFLKALCSGENTVTNITWRLSLLNTNVFSTASPHTGISAMIIVCPNRRPFLQVWRRICLLWWLYTSCQTIYFPSPSIVIDINIHAANYVT